MIKEEKQVMKSKNQQYESDDSYEDQVYRKRTPNKNRGGIAKYGVEQEDDEFYQE